jgi:hypothetical protein
LILGHACFQDCAPVTGGWKSLGLPSCAARLMGGPWVALAEDGRADDGPRSKPCKSCPRCRPCMQFRFSISSASCCLSHSFSASTAAWSGQSSQGAAEAPRKSISPVVSNVTAVRWPPRPT